MSNLNTDPDGLARQVGATMWSRDHATQSLDMSLVEISAGRALITMPVKKHMLNGHLSCHGGYMFTLADSAFAYACNSHNQNTVASACNIDFLAPAFEGDVLEAEAIERSLSGRTGVYDVSVRVRGGKVCALFRGKSYRVNGEVIAGPAEMPAHKK